MKKGGRLQKIIKNVSKVHQKMMRMNTMHDILSCSHTSIMKEKEEGVTKYLKYNIRKDPIIPFSFTSIVTV